MGKRLSMGCALLALTCGIVSAQQGFLVIVNETNPTSLINSNQASDLFLKKKTMWDNGKPVEPVDQTDSSAVRASFSEVVHGRSTSSVKSFWQRQIFSGSSTPPVELANDEAVIMYVREHPDAIGYVTPDASVAGVKAIPLMVVPVKTRGDDPYYTTLAQKARLRGQVILDVHVDDQGNVVQVDTVQGMRMGMTEAAVRAVKKWKYRPATIDGAPVDAQVRVIFDFAG
ncbi:MAG: TonB family protein [bacterium]|nr:TonB family protein [bacterium]